MRTSQTKKSRIVNLKALIVTVDIGKKTNMGYCRFPDGTEIKPFEFFNNGWGFKKFWSNVSKSMKSHNIAKAVAGLESTGVYGEPLMHFLRKKRNVRLVQVNPMHTKRLKELQGNSPNKTDKKDPKVIADIIELGHALQVIIPEGSAAELRRSTHARERAMQRRTVLFNQLQDLVFLIFPEFLQIMKNAKSKTSRYLLKHCPTPENIMKCGLEGLAQTLKKVSRGNMGKERANELCNAAKDSVGIKEGRDSILFEIEQCLILIDESDRFIKEIEGRMSQHLKEIPYSRFIQSIKGVGEVTVAGLIGEVGDFRKFSTIPEITKLAGFDLFEISSGKHKGQLRISKRGRPLMRKLLFFAAINTVRKGGIMHERYHRYLQNGMIKMKALIAVARKLLGIIFSLVRNHSEYVSEHTKAQTLKMAA